MYQALESVSFLNLEITLALMHGQDWAKGMYNNLPWNPEPVFVMDRVGHAVCNKR
jgi:hypothetical protein